MTEPIKNHVVVRATSSECEEYPGGPCLMDALGPYTHDEAREVAGRQPEWTRPHILRLTEEGLSSEGRVLLVRSLARGRSGPSR